MAERYESSNRGHGVVTVVAGFFLSAVGRRIGRSSSGIVQPAGTECALRRVTADSADSLIQFEKYLMQLIRTLSDFALP